MVFPGDIDVALYDVENNENCTVGVWYTQNRLVSNLPVYIAAQEVIHTMAIQMTLVTNIFHSYWTLQICLYI